MSVAWSLNLKTFLVRFLTVSTDVPSTPGYSIVQRLVLHLYKWNRSVQGNPVVYVLKQTASRTSPGTRWGEGSKAED